MVASEPPAPHYPPAMPTRREELQPAVGQFFGAPESVPDGKTIRVAPQASATRQTVHAADAPGWFGAESGTDVFASIAASQPPVTQNPSVQPVQQPSLQFSMPAQNSHASRGSFSSPNVPKIQSSVEAVPYSGFKYEETNFIGDETFEQLSISGSISAFGDIPPGSVACHRCNRPNDQSSTFCTRCGFQLVKPSGGFFTQSAYAQPPNTQPPMGGQFSNPPPIAPYSGDVVPLTRTGTLDSMVSGRFSQAPSSFTVQPSVGMASSASFGRAAPPSAPLVSHAFPPPQMIPPTSFRSFSPPQPAQMPFVLQPVAVEEPVKSQKEQRVYPVFCFGFGGQVFATFPMKQMRFMANSSTGTAHYRPSVMYRTAVHTLPFIQEKLVQPILDSLNGLPMSEKYVKTKDVIKYIKDTWIDGASPSRDYREVFYKLVDLMLSNKGGLSDAGEEALRKILLPDSLAEKSEVSSPTTMSAAPVSPAVVNELTKLLIKGDRGNAVLLAVTNQMWTHALLIASHVDRDTYCSVVSEFAKQTLPMGTADDYIAITGLGDALLSAGEVFAAHICYLLSDDASLISGVDSPQSRMVYAGCAHGNKMETFYRDWSALRRTELLELAFTLASNGQYCMHHLQAYKLLYSRYLSDLGLNSLALKYCDSVGSIVRTFGSTSPYLHKEFISQLKQFEERVYRHTGEVPSSPVGDGSWFKMGGLLEAFDRGITRVMGVSNQDVDITEVKEERPRRLSVQAETNLGPTVTEAPPIPMFSGTEMTAGELGHQPPVSYYQPPPVTSQYSQPQQQQWADPNQQQPFVSNHTHYDNFNPQQSTRQYSAPSQNQESYQQASGDYSNSVQSQTQRPLEEMMQTHSINDKGHDFSKPPQTQGHDQSVSFASPPQSHLGVQSHPVTHQHEQERELVPVIPVQKFSSPTEPHSQGKASTMRADFDSTFSAPPVGAPAQPLYAAPTNFPAPETFAVAPPTMPAMTETRPSGEASFLPPVPMMPNMPAEAPYSHQAPPMHTVPAVDTTRTQFKPSSPPADVAQTQFKSSDPAVDVTRTQFKPSDPAGGATFAHQPPTVPVSGALHQAPSVTAAPSFPPAFAEAQPMIFAGPQKSPPHPMMSASQDYSTHPPSFSQPPVQSHQLDDDLGFGNTTKLSPNKPEGQQPAIQDEDQQQDKKGMLGFISGWFGRKTPTDQPGGPKQASLGEPSSFKYDETLKRWIDTKDPGSTAAAVAPPPPPAMAAAPSMNPMSSDGPVSFRRGATRSAKSRYIDPFNADDGEAPPVIPTVPLPGSIAPLATETAPPQQQWTDPNQQQQWADPNQQQQQEWTNPNQQQQWVDPNQQTQWAQTHDAHSQQQWVDPNQQAQWSQAHEAHSQQQWAHPPQQQSYGQGAF
ncbi:hypothetical protein PSACC_02936 [Paramicrosporidium saccamoebae]|uniref:Protein transport protein sec16 n=1 Tax=Paramicrosporidium saccamoebae TaxID=1246581 RepID=A0A2H9THM0_9FUNG|nr:hypothetical protein PSACC_02936 [Paramicrosporidium saccamoebae]